ncbi:MAG TPA: hypothetical protein ACFYD0_10100 [Candidatus Wunengus sp. YC65]
MSIKKGKRLLDEVKDIMRLKHYSIHTERSYCDWSNDIFNTTK